jgi:AcrR family transcriptional regulator
MPKLAAAKVSFKQQMLQAREDAIVAVVNRLLADKGFEAMTVDEVAAAVGIAKASLYKHFPSKEALAAAAMVRMMGQAQAMIAALPADGAPLDQLRAVVRWTIDQQLDGRMPALPRQSSTLRAELLGNAAYMDALMDVSDRLGSWIEAAQKQGALNPSLPAVAILYSLYARACDPVLEFLQAGGLFTREQVVEFVMTACFEGLCRR